MPKMLHTSTTNAKNLAIGLVSSSSLECVAVVSFLLSYMVSSLCVGVEEIGKFVASLLITHSAAYWQHAACCSCNM